MLHVHKMYVNQKFPPLIYNLSSKANDSDTVLSKVFLLRILLKSNFLQHCFFPFVHSPNIHLTAIMSGAQF